MTHPAAPVLLGTSVALSAVRAAIDRLASSEAKVLVTGESGVGKDLVARAVHARSRRRDRPFVAVNCASFSEGLLESELFGHVRGSFTGAYRDKIGKLQQAHTGTIFLDEVAEMTLRMQAMLLRFLENGEIQPVGSDQFVRTVDVRVIAATNRDLDALVASGSFRDDLKYRLKVVHLHVPPLRERIEDVPLLVANALAASGRTLAVSDEALRALERYRWPGNVRELQNVIEQAAWTATGTEIALEHLPPAVRDADRARLTPVRERRRLAADDLYDGLLNGTLTFWEHVHPLFMNRDLTRNELRHLVCRALATTGGSYRALLRLFNMRPVDYKRFLNFLAAHDCTVDFRPFRSGQHEPDAAGVLAGAGLSSGPRLNPLAR